MSLNDSSAIILIVGALAVIAFVIHGLWFSGKTSNRRLNKSSETDQVLQNSGAVGKVRIVSGAGSDDTQAADGGSLQISDTPATRIERQQQSRSEDNEGVQPPPAPIKKRRPDEVYEINVESETDRPFSGAQIEDLFNELGFVRSQNDVYVCPESVDKDIEKSAVVFRICSLKKPFRFPADMKDYETNAVAFYIRLPESGKGEGYFNCMRCAAQEFADRLGGKLLDPNGAPFTDQKLDEIAGLLREYDAPRRTKPLF